MKVKITESELKKMVSKVVNEELKQFSNKAKLKKTLRESIKTVLSEDVKEAINDFFNFLETDPRKGSFATVYYTAPYSSPFNKFYVDENGEKQLNPYRGKVYKHQYIQFNFGETYKRAVERNNPDWEMQQRKGEFEKLGGYDVIEAGKNGLYLPVIPKNNKSAYSVVDENGNHELVDYETLKPYMAVRKAYEPGSGVNFRLLLVDRIYKLRAGGGKEWVNPHFTETYVGPQ